jgi:hypothetical protein
LTVISQDALFVTLRAEIHNCTELTDINGNAFVRYTDDIDWGTAAKTEDSLRPFYSCVSQFKFNVY